MHRTFRISALATCLGLFALALLTLAPQTADAKTTATTSIASVAATPLDGTTTAYREIGWNWAICQEVCQRELDECEASCGTAHCFFECELQASECFDSCWAY